jgi:hypothetical protein
MKPGSPAVVSRSSIPGDKAAHDRKTRDAVLDDLMQVV